jgi:MFS family permease
MPFENDRILIIENLSSRPLAVIFGRRPVYLASNLLMCLACIWLAIASKTTFTSFIVARAFLGLWEAPIEAIVPSTITDIFHLHERGEQVSYYGLTVLVGNEIGPLVSAFIIQALDMRWAFFIVAMSIGVNMISMVVSMPESMYHGDRPVINPVRTDTEKPTENFEHIDNPSNGSVPPVTAKKRSFLQDLLYFHANKDMSLWKVFKRPFILMAYPTVLWSSLVYGMSLSWNVILGATVAQLFAPP